VTDPEAKYSLKRKTNVTTLHVNVPRTRHDLFMTSAWNVNVKCSNINSSKIGVKCL